MQITVIRHLPTAWNIKTWLQGRRDIGLADVTETDYVKISENQRHLQQQAPFDIVLASTLKRTQQTAHLYGYQPEIEPLLDELDFGPFEGVPRKRLFEASEGAWVKNPESFVLGESMCDFWERILLFLEKYQDRNRILIFGHGAWLRALKSYEQYGHMNNMNKITLENNTCLTIVLD